MGQNRLIPFWIPITPERFMEYCFFWFERALLGFMDNCIALDCASPNHKMVQGGEQICRCTACTLFLVGMFCDPFKLQDMGIELIVG